MVRILSECSWTSGKFEDIPIVSLRGFDHIHMSPIIKFHLFFDGHDSGLGMANSRNGLAQKIESFPEVFWSQLVYFSGTFFCHGWNSDASEKTGSAPLSSHQRFLWLPTTSTFQSALGNSVNFFLATSGHQSKNSSKKTKRKLRHQFSPAILLALGPWGHGFQASSCPTRTTWWRSWSAMPRGGPTGAWWSPSRRVRRRRVRRPSRDGSQTGGFHRKMPIGCRTEMGNDGIWVNYNDLTATSL